MLLREIRLQNVGLYRGDQRLEFSCDKQRPVTLIGGRNGSGKTTLLEAIPLALYGNRARRPASRGSYGDYLTALTHNGATSSSITLVFDRQENGAIARYVVERGWTLKGGSAATDAIHVTVDDAPRPDLEASWPEYVECLMPLSVSALALFDGERIEALADIESSREVLRTSLYGLLGLNLIEQLNADLAGYRRRSAKQAPAPDETLRLRLGQAEDVLGEALAEAEVGRLAIVASEKEFEVASGKLHAAKEHLAHSGGDLFEQREVLHSQLAAAESAAATALRNLENFVVGDLPLLLVKPLLNRVVAVGDRVQAAEEATLLLDRMKERDEKLLVKAELDGRFTSDLVLAFAGLLSEARAPYDVDDQVPYPVSETARQLSRELAGARGEAITSEVAGLLQFHDEERKNADALSGALKSVPDATTVAHLVRGVAESEERVMRSQAQAEAASSKLAYLERRVATAQRKVDLLATAVLEAGAEHSNTARIAREIDLASATLERFTNRVVGRHIDRISEQITECLRVLLRKQDLIDVVRIHPRDLSVSLISSDGHQIDARRLSAGERQMLATAVLWGLSKSTGRTLPTVIDTPVGRLDRSHRTNLIERYFPSAARQVILLSTDEEIVGGYYTKLKPHIGATYLLTSPNEGATEITKGYF